MNEDLIINPDNCYKIAEQKAADYFNSLLNQISQKKYVQALTDDLKSWKARHIHHPAFFSHLAGKKKTSLQGGYRSYIQWLDYTGKLDDYLDRSISYIYLRDLGKELTSSDIQSRISNEVAQLKKYLTESSTRNTNEIFSFAGLYRWAKKENIESTIIWLFEKLKTVSLHIPTEMDAENAQRKLIKIIAGVVIHVLHEMEDTLAGEERSKKLAEAIRLGYAYGLTYPFIDDILDAEVLSESEKQQYSMLIRTTLITGTVPELTGWSGDNKELIRYIHGELKGAYEYIKAQQPNETQSHFFELSYVFFQSQEIDRLKTLSHPHYTNEELYIPIILKSSSSRLMARSIISALKDEGFTSRTFYYGIYNQLADDFADMFQDMEDGAVTPYTYYIKYHHMRPDLINPFELYWAVIANLIHHVYHSDPKTSEVILDRAINGLKRFKNRFGNEKYKEVMGLFATGNSSFYHLLQKTAAKADDVDFFDKLLRDHMLTSLKKERLEREDFLETIKTARNQINDSLMVQRNENALQIEYPIFDAANYSLEGSGKRLRPIITWVMGVKEYGLRSQEIVPLLRSLEYMHTASLIFDDLPSQDNSSSRRGRPTLHHVYNTATAELTGLYLTQKAVEEQASLDQFDSKTVLSLIQYSAQVTQAICAGQAFDLASKGKPLSLEQLSQLSFYKTGLAFEASLIMPAILVQEGEREIEVLKKFAYHAGIAFQIKDDLLDVEGDPSILGKPTGKDAENTNTTFVTILGLEGAKKALWDQYCLALEALQGVPLKTAFLKHLLNYIVNRNH